METTQIDRTRFAPCGYCRRCAIHDDPGGCLEVSAYERELVESGATSEEIWPNATEEQRAWYLADTIEHMNAIKEWEVSHG